MSDLLERIKLYNVWIGKDNSQEIIDLIEQQQQRIEELEQRNNELYATVERLRIHGAEVLNNCFTELGYRSESLWHATKIASGSVSFEDSVDALACSINATEQQNLNAVKREAFADGYYQGFCRAWDINFDCEDDHADYGLEQSEIEANTKYPIGKDIE